MRFDDKLHPAGLECFINSLNVVNFVIDDRGGMIQFGPVCYPKHQTNPITVKESHVRRGLKQKFHAQRVAVKGNRPIQILKIAEDLSAALQRRSHWYSIAICSVA